MKKIFLIVIVLLVLSNIKVKSQVCTSSITGIGSATVNAISSTPSYTWFGTNTTLAYYNGTSYVNVITSNTVNDIFVQPNFLLASTINGVIAVNTISMPYIEDTIHFPSLVGNAQCVILADNNHLWIGGENGLIRFDYSTKIIEDTLLTIDIRDLYYDQAASLMYVATDNGLYVYNSQTLNINEHYTLSNSDLTTNNISSVLLDKDFNLWVGTKGTPGEGVFRLNTTSVWANYNHINGDLYSNTINDITEDINGNIWFATNNGLTYYDGQRWKTFTTSYGIASNIVKCINVDISGDYRIGTEMGATLISTGIIDVTVTSLSSTIGQGDVYVELYYNHPNPSTGYDKFAKVYTNANGHAIVKGLLDYAYYIKATVENVSGFPNDVSTYYSNGGGALIWDTASTVNAVCGSTINKNIELKEFATLTGNGEVSGKVNYFSNNKAQGEPVPGIQVLVEQEPNDDPVAYATGNSQGEYTIPHLPNATYSLRIDIPGMPIVSTYQNFDINSSSLAYTNMNFLIDTTVASGGAYADSTNSIFTDITENLSLKLYPNPTADNITILFESKINQRIDVNVLSLDGKLVFEQEKNIIIGKNNIFIDINKNKIAKGTYFVKIKTESNIYIKKLIVQ